MVELEGLMVTIELARRYAHKSCVVENAKIRRRVAVILPLVSPEMSGGFSAR
jgi:hypothetical protein